MVNASHAGCSAGLEVDGLAAANLVLLFFLFMSLGVTIHLNDFWAHIVRPRGVLVAVLVQFFVMPAIAYGTALSFASMALKIALVVQLCSPGGALSNIITIIFRMDVPLSLAATSVSSIVAMGMMPLNLHIYLTSTGLAQGVCVQPFGVFLAASVVVLGVLVGMVMRRRGSMRVLDTIISIGGIAGVAILILAVVFNTKSSVPLWKTDPYIFGMILLLPLVSMSLGGLVMVVMRRPLIEAVTVTVECGVPNKVLCSAVLSVLFNDPVARDEAFAIPFLYGITSTVEVVVFALVAWKLGWTGLSPKTYLWDGLVEARREMKREKEARLQGLDQPSGAGAAPPNGGGGGVGVVTSGASLSGTTKSVGVGGDEPPPARSPAQVTDI